MRVINLDFTHKIIVNIVPVKKQNTCNYEASECDSINCRTVGISS